MLAIYKCVKSCVLLNDLNCGLLIVGRGQNYSPEKSSELSFLVLMINDDLFGKCIHKWIIRQKSFR